MEEGITPWVWTEDYVKEKERCEELDLIGKAQIGRSHLAREDEERNLKFCQLSPLIGFVGQALEQTSWKWFLFGSLANQFLSQMKKGGRKSF